MATLLVLAAIGLAWQAFLRAPVDLPLIDEAPPQETMPGPGLELDVRTQEDVDYTGTSQGPDGLVLDVAAPAQVGPWPLVVIAVGGPKEPYRPFAEELASRGAVVLTTYWSTGTEFHVPSPEDLATYAGNLGCAVRHARSLATRHVSGPEHVVMLGHGMGGFAAALLSLTGDAFPPEACATGRGSPTPDAFVGFGGHYHWIRDGFETPMQHHDLGDYPAALDPFEQVASRPDLPVVLLHPTGAGINQLRPIPPETVEAFADGLRDGGHAVEFEVLDGASLADLYSLDSPFAEDVIAHVLSGGDAPA